jgi:hypothetical protein
VTGSIARLPALGAAVLGVAFLAAACGGAGTGSASRKPAVLPPPGFTPGQCTTPRARAARAAVLGSGPDSDGDGVTDGCEQSLAERFAPVVYHSSLETRPPANVDWFLARSELWYLDDACTPDLHRRFIWHPSQTEIARQRFTGGCGSTDTVYSWGTRSKGKHRTFYLGNVTEKVYYPTYWTTYFHAYPNDAGGVTVQYWRFYPVNRNFSGDWEGVMIVLDAQLQPRMLGFIWRGDLNRKRPTEVEWEGTHFRVYSEPNEHGSSATAAGLDAENCQGDDVTMTPDNPCTTTRQQTWTGGLVYLCQKFDDPASLCRIEGRTGTPGGPLVNVGEKSATMNRQDFVRYSGLWGDLAGFGHLEGDGWWGPAYFGTQITDAGFVTSWCTGMLRDQAALARECYPSPTIP